MPHTGHLFDPFLQWVQGRGPQASSPRCPQRLCRKQEATWLLLSPYVQRDVLRAEPLTRTGSPTRRARATCACWRPRTWSGAWTATRARACSRCARAPSPSRTAATARGATSTSMPSAATARRCRASFCGTGSARPHACRPQCHVPALPRAPVVVTAGRLLPGWLEAPTGQGLY